MENSSNSLIYLLQNKVYRKLWGIGLVQAIMRWMELTALGIFVFQLTESPFWVAMVGFSHILPLFLFGSLLGLFSEKYQRKKIIFISYFILSIINSLLFFLAIFEAKDPATSSLTAPYLSIKSLSTPTSLIFNSLL